MTEPEVDTTVQKYRATGVVKTRGGRVRTRPTRKSIDLPVKQLMLGHKNVLVAGRATLELKISYNNPMLSKVEFTIRGFKSSVELSKTTLLAYLGTILPQANTRTTFRRGELRISMQSRSFKLQLKYNQTRGSFQMEYEFRR